MRELYAKGKPRSKEIVFNFFCGLEYNEFMDEPQQQSSQPKESVIAPPDPTVASESAQESTAESAVAPDSIVESPEVQAQPSQTSQNLESEKKATEPIEPVKLSEPVSRPMIETQVDASTSAAEVESVPASRLEVQSRDPDRSIGAVNVEPPELEVQERPASPEQQPASPNPSLGGRGEVVEKIIEKTVSRELNEEEQQALYRSRLKILSAKGNQSRSNRRLANHQKIIEYLKQHGYITNDEVEKICGVKDSTATKYLKELQKLGQILPVGRTRYIRWRLVQAI